MIMRMYAVKDRVMNLYMNPMFFTSRGHAIRVVSDEVNRSQQGQEPPTSLQSHPEDCELWELAEYDNETGVVTPCLAMIANCKDYLTGRS